MKKIKIVFLVSISILLSGCNDLLEKEPLANVSTSSSYETEADALKAVTAAYQPLRQNVWFSPGGNNFAGYMYWVFGDIASDNALKGGESASDQIYAYNIAHFNITSTNTAVGSAWKALYIGVHRANLVLKYVPEIEMDEALKNRLLAEAKFLRGYYYFQLVKLFGGVPLILKADLESYDLGRSSSEEVYAQIVKDLTEAEQVLPKRSEYAPENIGRATKGAARAYLGKVYLYQQNFEQAEAWFAKVINSGEYSLAPDYYHMFTIDGENGPGIIFAVKYKFSSQYSTGNVGSVVRGSRGMYGWGFVCPTQDFVDAFEPGDPRLHQTVYADGDTMPEGTIADIGNSPTGYLNKKAYLLLSERPSGSIQQSGKDEIMMRLGKVLLWYAEAANENGHTQTALKALNRVRERARQGNPNVLPPITETNKAALRKIIWHEQRVEYGLEHERFFDLVRQGRAADVLHAFAEKYNTTKGANFKEGVNEIFPIPQSEIDLSQGKLEQNEGYF